MEIRRVQYAVGRGWSEPLPDLDSASTLVLVFGASRFRVDDAPLAELRQHFRQAVVAGCSTSGEVDGERIADDSLVVAVTRFERTRLRMACERLTDDGTARELGEQLTAALWADDLRGVVLLSDGLAVNGTELVRGVTGGLPDEVVVTGGLAGDGDRFECTWVLDGDGRPQSSHVAAVGFYGDAVRFGHGSRGGWDSFGPERRITRSVGSVLYELDGRPALELYKEYLGDRAAGLPATGLLFPLAIRADEGVDKQLVRTILAVDDETNSMTFAGDVPEGAYAQLMMANFDRLIDGAADAAQAARHEDENALATLAIAVSCVGRRLVLGERAEEELEVTREVLPDGAELVGFYSYGEISPSADGRCDLHNQTMTLTTIQEL